jgi:hypothetical protein
MPVIPALRRLKKEDHQFKANLGYIANSRPASATQVIMSPKQTYIKTYPFKNTVQFSSLQNIHKV